MIPPNRAPKQQSMRQVSPLSKAQIYPTVIGPESLHPDWKISLVSVWLIRLVHDVSIPLVRLRPDHHHFTPLHTTMTSTASFNISGRLFGNINLGPLTTIFTPPSSCLTDLFLPGSDAPLDVTLVHPTGTFIQLVPTGTYPLLGWPTQTECYPSGYQAASSMFRSSQGTLPVAFGGYFSPAACPSGYTSACPEEVLLSSAGEEIAVCCPRYESCYVIWIQLPLTRL